MTDWLKMTAAILLIAAALNWGLVGLFNFDLIGTYLPALKKWVYILAGAAAVYAVFQFREVFK